MVPVASVGHVPLAAGIAGPLPVVMTVPLLLPLPLLDPASFLGVDPELEPELDPELLPLELPLLPPDPDPEPPSSEPPPSSSDAEVEPSGDPSRPVPYEGISVVPFAQATADAADTETSPRTDQRAIAIAQPSRSCPDDHVEPPWRLAKHLSRPLRPHFGPHFSSRFKIAGDTNGASRPDGLFRSWDITCSAV
jgi:hypothetical protein